MVDFSFFQELRYFYSLLLVRIREKVTLLLPGLKVIGESEVAFSTQSCGICRNRADLIESATSCQDAQVVGPCHPSRLTVLAAMSEDYTTAPQHLWTSSESRTVDLLNVAFLDSRHPFCCIVWSLFFILTIN